MSIDGDYPSEMPEYDLIDDATAEALLGGHLGGRAELALLAGFVEDVTLVGQGLSGPLSGGQGHSPAPSPALASVLEGGFSTDKGDLLVTAASNATGPAATQVAGLPKWRNEKMQRSGFASAIFAKVSSMGAGAKAAVAAMAMTGLALTGGAAAGALPGPVQNAVAGVVSAVTPFNVPGGAGAGEHQQATGSVHIQAAPVAGDISASAGTQADAGGSTAAAPSGAAAGTGTGAGTGGSAKAGGSVTPSIPTLGSRPVPDLPTLPAGTSLPACVKDLIPAAGSIPDPSVLLAQVPGCVQSVLASQNVPVDVARCVNSVLASLPAPGSISSVGNLAALDLSACVPVDLTQCASSFMGAMKSLSSAAGGGLGGTGGFGSLSSWTQFSQTNIPGVSGLGGCVPQNVTTCLTSVLGGLAGATPGSAPDVDLSSCLPVSPTGSLPGLSDLSKLPGFANLGGLAQFIPRF